MPDRRDVALAAAGLTLAAAGAFAWWSPSANSSNGPTPGSAASTTGSAAPATGASDPASAPAEPPRTRPEPGDPEQLSIPALGVSAPVVPVRAPGRTLVPPGDPTTLGWWADGARPGAARGSALVAGHTVHTGGGALDDLEDVRRGDRVVVRTDRGRITYVVRQVHVYDKGRIADDATRLFSQQVPGRLVIVTCEDWDGEQYLSNVVVTATPVG